MPEEVYDKRTFPVHLSGGKVLLTTANRSWKLQDLHQSLLTTAGCSDREYDVLLLLGDRKLPDDLCVCDVELSQGDIVQAVITPRTEAKAAEPYSESC